MSIVASNPLEVSEHIARKILAPQAGETDRQGLFPSAAVEALRDQGLLGLLSASGLGGTLAQASAVVERLAQECPSTAMILTMHYCSVVVAESLAPPAIRQELTRELATLAFSESGSRSHFWLPVSSATPVGDRVRLDGSKQMITAAAQAKYYIWSSKPAQAPGLSSLWLVPAATPGLSVTQAFDGLGLRGNGSAPIAAREVTIGSDHLLGPDGGGFDIMMGTVLPTFSALSCSVSLGLMEGAFRRTVAHVTESKYSYDQSTLADLPQVRGHLGKMKLRIDMLRGFLQDVLAALANSREDAMVRVLEAKLAGGETALEVLDLAMRVCGGAAFRRDVEVERFFRDGRASSIMAPVPDALYDFLGKASCGMPLFD